MALRCTGPGLLCAAILCTNAAWAVDPSTTPGEIEAWRDAARHESLNAKMQLGIAYDLGWGVEQDKEQALRWYRKAAEAGDPEAQFNVAVLLDAGVVPSNRETGSALSWYTRAAANGLHRAQYNLGMIYLEGESVARNPDLSAIWFERAARALPAAAEKLGAVSGLRVDERSFSKPDLPAGALVAFGTARFAELSWTAGPGPETSEFLVEILGWNDADRDWSAPLVSARTQASGFVSGELPAYPAYAWRVSRIDLAASRYVATSWMTLGALRPAHLPNASAPQELAARNEDASRVAGRIVDENKND